MCFWLGLYQWFSKGGSGLPWWVTASFQGIRKSWVPPSWKGHSAYFPGSKFHWTQWELLLSRHGAALAHDDVISCLMLQPWHYEGGSGLKCSRTSGLSSKFYCLFSSDGDHQSLTNLLNPVPPSKPCCFPNLDKLQAPPLCTLTAAYTGVWGCCG